MKNFIKSVIFTGLLTAMPLGAQPHTYQVDGAHSKVGFTVTHLQLSEIDGRFNDFQGSVVWDAKKPENSKVQFTVKADSIDTGNAKRDAHLKNDDFFAADKFPTLTFSSTSVKKLSGEKYSLIGDLTVHGVTKRVTLPATIKGPVDPLGQGKMAIGFDSRFKINRIDYGVGAGWQGGSDKLVGHDVFITVKGEAYRGE